MLYLKLMEDFLGQRPGSQEIFSDIVMQMSAKKMEKMVTVLREVKFCESMERIYTQL